MNKEQKAQVIKEFLGIFGEPGVYLLDFKGLNVAEITELRSKLRAANVSMRVVKNTLAKRALKEGGIQGLSDFFIGPTSVVWSNQDSIMPARQLVEFLKKYKKGTIKAGLVDGVIVKDSEIETLSKLPNKQELYAKLAATLNAPIVKLAMVLNAVPQKFVRIVDALRESKQ